MIRCIVAGTDDSPTARVAVREAVALARRTGARLHLVGCSARPPAWVVADPSAMQSAAAVGADLIVVGNRGMHGMGRILGSVPRRVSRQAPCSVMIVRTC